MIISYIVIKFTVIIVHTQMAYRPTLMYTYDFSESFYFQSSEQLSFVNIVNVLLNQGAYSQEQLLNIQVNTLSHFRHLVMQRKWIPRGELVKHGIQNNGIAE